MTRHRQQGMAGVVMLIILAVTYLTVGVKTVPHYIDNYYVREAVKAVLADGAATRPLEMTKVAFNNRLSINNVQNFTADKLEWKKDGNEVKVVVKYQIEEPLAENIFITLKFDDTLTNK